MWGGENENENEMERAKENERGKEKENGAEIEGETFWGWVLGRKKLLESMIRVRCRRRNFFAPLRHLNVNYANPHLSCPSLVPVALLTNVFSAPVRSP